MGRSMRMADTNQNMHPDTVCWGDGEQIPWEEYQKIREKEMKENENK